VVGLVGVSGHAGVGKTTAAKHLSMLTGGYYLYLGQTVLDEVQARRLASTPDNERRVRIDLRREGGPAALVKPHVGRVSECLKNGVPVFVDAIFVREEFEVLASCVPTASSARLLAIKASFDMRSKRLKDRLERPFSAVELRERDKTERETLGTDAIIAMAKYTILNEKTIDEFYLELAEFLSR